MTCVLSSKRLFVLSLIILGVVIEANLQESSCSEAFEKSWNVGK